MTKLKNTKKGMAKKALSISLVAAMLATSNVPVWAAEFTDGTDAVVEAPVVEEFTAEAPVEEETNTDTFAANGDFTNDSQEVNTVDYVMQDLALNVNAWGTDTTVSGSVKTKTGEDVNGLKYTWLADGVQAAGTDATGTATGNVNTIKYNPTQEDFNKTLSLEIYVESADGTKIFSKTITGDKVKPYTLTSELAPVVDDQPYNGKEQKVSPSNADKFCFSSLNITSDQITWSYTVKDNDFTNVTDNAITVVGTLKGTYDKNSTAYGYTYTSVEDTYKITKLAIGTSNMEFKLNKTAVPYTGSTHTFKLSDASLFVNIKDDAGNVTSQVDITKAFKPDFTFSGTDTAVGTGYTAGEFNLGTLKTKVADTAEAESILANFDINSWNSGILNSKNTYEITMLNLSTCTGVVTREYTVDEFKANPTVAAADIKLTTADGTSFTLADLTGDVNIATNQVAIDAAKNNKKGVINNAITISYKTDTKNVTGSISLPITLTTRSLSSATVNVFVDNNLKIMGTSTSETPAFHVTYNGSAYDLLKTSTFFNGFAIGVGNENLKSDEYELSYNDNVNAGVVEVTIKGKGSYEGSTKKVYFAIDQANVTAGSLKTAKTSVTVNPNNNSDPALYKDAIGAQVKTKLNKKDVILEEGKDYTVKYYYAKTAGLDTEDKIKADAGTNNVGNYVYVVATPVKGGNYKFASSETGDLIASVSIAKKSISDVTVTVEKEAYTFTGEEIIPNVTVKDGSSVLERGVDYTVKVKDNVDVGTATVTIIPTAESEYDDDTVATATFKIEAAKAEDVKVTLGETKSAVPVTGKTNVFEYNKGKQIKPSVNKVTLNGVDVTKYFEVSYPTYGENANAGKEAGSVTISPKKSPANFTGTKTQLFDIKGKALNGTLKAYYNDKTQVNVNTDKIALNKSGNPYSFYYDGTAHTFADEAFTVAGNVDAKEGVDYEIKYIDNVDAGYGFVAVIAKGNYEGGLTIANWNNAGVHKMLDGKLTEVETNTVLATNVVDIIAFKINPSIFTAKNITVANGTYAGGLPVKPNVNVTVNGKVLAEGIDYTLELTSIDGKTTPDKFTVVTADKPYYVTVKPMGGYAFDNVNGTNKFVWGIDKKDLNDCSVSVVKDGADLSFTVMNGNVKETVEKFELTDNGNGTATISVVNDGVNYTGSKTVSISKEDTFVEAPVIKEVKVVGNKATVVLEGDCDGATGYDYVISTNGQSSDAKRLVNKNVLATDTTFQYLQQGIYWAHCHAWKKVDGKKVFSAYSEAYPFSVTAITPDQPSVTSVKVSKNTVKVTYTKSKNATGYDLVLGKSMKKVNGEMRPVEYGKLVKKVYNGNTVTATFTKVPKGTYYVGLHAYNRTSENGKKVFSPWSNAKKVVVK